MATNVVASLRDYLAARDLDTEVAGGLVVDHLSQKPLVLERLPTPLPQQVRSVALSSLFIFGGVSGVGALYVAGGAISVVVMPMLMGREGVGTAMITLFTVCVTFVLSGILLLAARSAARVVRREKRGVRALYSFTMFSTIVSVLASLVALWLSVAFFDEGVAGLSSRMTSIVISGIPLLFAMWFARTAFVLKHYMRTIEGALRA